MLIAVDSGFYIVSFVQCQEGCSQSLCSINTDALGAIQLFVKIKHNKPNCEDERKINQVSVVYPFED